MGFETQEAAEAWAENMEARADAAREEKMLASFALTYQPREVKLRERIEFLRAALLGVRGMAEAEASNGSKPWAKAVETIDAVLKLDA